MARRRSVSSPAVDREEDAFKEGPQISKDTQMIPDTEAPSLSDTAEAPASSPTGEGLPPASHENSSRVMLVFESKTDPGDRGLVWSGLVTLSGEPVCVLPSMVGGAVSFASEAQARYAAEQAGLPGPWAIVAVVSD